MVTRTARVSAKGAATLAMLAIAGLAAAATASAHVTVSATGATAGGSDQVITFRVPTESGTASTTGLSVQLPTNTPIASVLVAPHTGWTAKVNSVRLTKPIKTDDGEITEAVSTIVWTANNKSDGIEPGQFDQFVIIAGQLPDVSSLTFRAIQTYSDGSTVAWIETAAPGSTAEPDHPAPVLSLAPAASGGSAAATAAPGPATKPATLAAGEAASGASKGAATTGIVLGIVGILLGAAALVLALVRRRSELAHD